MKWDEAGENEDEFVRVRTRRVISYAVYGRITFAA